MSWPQITLIILLALSLGITAEGHGKERPPYNFLATFIGTALMVFLLWAGGFWS